MKGTSLGATVHYFTTRLLNGIQKQEKIKPYKVSSIQSVPSHIIRPSYVGSISNPAIVKDPEVHDDTGIHHMRNAGRLAASALEYARSLVKPGITTDEIDKAVHKMIIGAGAYPSPLGYKGFPKSICTSVNEVAFHGIPDLRPLEDGDIINIDVTIYLNGYHADTSKTFLCGNVNNNAMQLVEVTFVMRLVKKKFERFVEDGHTRVYTSELSHGYTWSRTNIERTPFVNALAAFMNEINEGRRMERESTQPNWLPMVQSRSGMTDKLFG